MGAFAFVAWKLGFFHRNGPQKVVAAAEKVGGRQWLAPIFIVIYATMAAFAIPATMLAYAAGAVFGFVRGAIYVWIASMIGAVAGYSLARGVLAKSAERLLGPKRDKMRRLDKGNGVIAAARMRLTPFIPFGVLTYAAAIAKLRPVPFLIGTAIGIIPAVLLATFIGDRFVAGVSGHSKTGLWLGLAMSLTLLAISFAPRAIEKIRKR